MNQPSPIRACSDSETTMAADEPAAESCEPRRQHGILPPAGNTSHAVDRGSQITDTLNAALMVGLLPTSDRVRPVEMAGRVRRPREL